MDRSPSGRTSREYPAHLVLGLGNPGERYRDTRHNLGFRVVEELARRRGLRLALLECNCLLADHRDVTLAAPQTYMNRSGYGARCLRERRGLEPEAMLVVFDDVNLPLGRLRLRARGGAGGHQGMASVLQGLQTEGVPRLRLGVGPEEGTVPGEELEEYVLTPFPADQRPLVEELVTRAADACESWLETGVERTMTAFNN